MLAEIALRRLISPRTAERGDAYFAQGRVRRIEEGENGLLRVAVQGSRLYSVDLIREEDVLIVRCECPWFVDQQEECKHIWAAIRAASAKDLLPEYPLGLVLDDGDEPVEFNNVHPFPTTAQRGPAPWERFLQALGPVNPALGQVRKQPTIPDEIAYVIVPIARSQTLTLQLLGRIRKKNGEWTKWKPLSLQMDDLKLLEPFDRESISLLHQRAYHHILDSTISIASAMTSWWVERLGRAGKLYLSAGNDVPLPLAWDDGPPWTFRVAIVNDATEAKYRVVASIERKTGNTLETLPFSAISAIVNDVVITNGRAGRFEDGGHAPWLHAVRGSGPIEIPHSDAERFRQSLLRAPIGNVSLPEELGWQLVTAAAKPVLSLWYHDFSAELQGELFFVYDDWRVSGRSHEMQRTTGRKLIRRDRAAEDRYRARLSGLAVIATADGYRVRLAQIEELAHVLIAEGWAIEVNETPLRVTDDVDVEISSGIDWFDLNVSATFGDLKLGLPELLEAAESRRSFLRLSDGSFGIVPVSWAEALAPVVELGKKEGDGVRFRPAQALLVDTMLQAKTHRTDESFASLRQKFTSISPEPRQEPATLLAELRPYQRAGLGWLHFLRSISVGGCLADDMGLGKTVQTLALLEGMRVEGNTRPSLVVAPRSLLFNWAAEAKKFAPQLRVKEHHGAERMKSVEAFNDCDVVLTTYATMRLDIAHLAGIDFEYVILDEAQAIKNATSQVAKASRLLRSRHRLALSGTPIENHLGELWSLFEFLNPGLLGSSRSFQRTFAARNTPPERRDALARALRPLILRRTKEQVAPELPERTEQTLYCELEGAQKAQYEELRDHYRAALLGKVRSGGIDKSRMQILEALLRLRQAACHPALIDAASNVESAKSELLMDELREVLASGHRALVFSQFTSFLALVRRELDKQRIPYLYLDGKTADRQSLVEKFQGAGGPPLFLISLKAGGLGLNLTNADYIFLLDPWWNPAVEAQAIDRAHRIGRLRPVVAYRLIARDTVEEKILELQARKRELAESIISEDNSVLRRLEVEDLELLLS